MARTIERTTRGTFDLRDYPAYSVSAASHYLRIPRATLSSWVVGRSYATRRGPRRFHPLIEPADAGRHILSFVNLVEAHVLSAIRKEHGVQLAHVRSALRYLREQFRSKHPLAEQRFESDGIDLFVEKYGQLINVSRPGQLALRDLLHARLKRVERDQVGKAIRLYPYPRIETGDEPRVVVIDPKIAFGRPVLSGTGIPTAVIAERFNAGDSVDELARDYGRERLEIEEAIRCELEVEAA